MRDSHPDPVCDLILQHIQSSELIQSIGRARGAQRTEDNPVNICLFNQIPLEGIKFAFMAHYTEAAGLPLSMTRQLIEGGIAISNTHHLPLLYPNLVSSVSSAKAFLGVGGWSRFPISILFGKQTNLSSFRYRLDKKGTKPATAYFDKRRINFELAVEMLKKALGAVVLYPGIQNDV